MIEHSPEIKDLAEALRLAQSGLDGVRKVGTNPHFKNRYATLEAVIDTAKGPLANNGIAFTQAPGAIINGAVEITTMLMHAASGQWMRSTLHVPITKNDAQGVGSALTYGQRYSLMAVLGLPPIDDDGQAAAVQSVTITADILIGLIKKARNERELQRTTNDPGNIAAYEAASEADQTRISDAITQQRGTFPRVA